MMKNILIVAFSLVINTAFSQHEHHTDKMKDSTSGKDSMMTMDGMNGMHNMHDMKHKMNMSSAYSLSLPMNRNGSGTSWQPDNSPMYMIMSHDKAGGMWMFHGSVFLRYNNQELFKKTARGASKFDAPNWFMAMYNRPVGKNGLFTFSSMFSLDPLTVGKAGYPLLFQSGETYKGQSLVDAQHPHDLFSELSIGYTQRLSKKVDVYASFGYPGEPAIGPNAFMHRSSAMNDPDAVLGHHWQDATHITFGVATVGVRVDKFKAEVSKFTGREPGEDRYNFDKPSFNSFSYRLSYNPNKALSVQFSQGYIKSPESLHPEENIWRYTSSVLYASPVTSDGKFFTSALVWGYNDAGAHHKEHSLLLEGTRQLKKQAIYGRYEFVQKSAEELSLEDTYGDAVFDIHKLSLGTNRKLFSLGPLDVLGGAQMSFNLPPNSLHALYGKLPVAGEIYLQLRPGLML